MSDDLGEWNDPLHPYPNGCCSLAAFQYCLKHGLILNNTHCLHPDRDTKTCREIHGDEEIEELSLAELRESACGGEG